MKERRPHLTVRCPVTGCDWVQVTSWWTSPETTEAVPPVFRQIEAEMHLSAAHAIRRPTIIV